MLFRSSSRARTTTRSTSTSARTSRRRSACARCVPGPPFSPPLDFVFRLRSWGLDAYLCWGQMPTFIAFKGGERVKEVSGANPGALQVEIDSFEFVLRREMADQRRCRL